MKEAAVFVEVIRELDRKEYDFEETGPMFRVRFQDGYETCAFEDELMERFAGERLKSFKEGCYSYETIG